VAFFASAENISTELNKILLEWNTAMAKANVTTRARVPDHVTLEEWRKKDSEHKREVRIVPNHLYSAKSAIEVFPDFVRIVMFGDLQCTIIEDKEFATACRQIFEIAWSAVPSNT
jgi:hypothetical protein